MRPVKFTRAQLAQARSQRPAEYITRLLDISRWNGKEYEVDGAALAVLREEYRPAAATAGEIADGLAAEARRAGQGGGCLGCGG